MVSRSQDSTFRGKDDGLERRGGGRAWTNIEQGNSGSAIVLSWLGVAGCGAKDWVSDMKSAGQVRELCADVRLSMTVGGGRWGEG